MPASGANKGPLVAPLLLRLALGVTFIWAGLGKLVPTVEYAGQDAAILANLGTGVAPTQPLAPLTSPASGAGTPATPSLAPPAMLPLPDAPAPTSPAASPGGGTKSGEKTNSKAKPSNRPSRTQTGVGSAVQGTLLAALSTDDLPAAARSDRARSASRQPQPAPNGQPTKGHPTGPSSATTLPPGGRFTATDFPEPARARRAYGLAVVMVKAAYPQPAPGRPAPDAHWPKGFAAAPWVIWLAFGAAVVELFGGVLVLVGFLTRLSAGMLVLVMLTAMWLTQIGPAVSSGQTQFGFLPDKTWWDPQAWSTFLWQLLIMASGLALMATGAGLLSVDRALAVIGSGGPKAEPEPSAKG
ncbi:MAG: DoxX family membrane protein [Phycisphaerales bacterium]|nr:DoxX family membrane protein [Phycisphaerales bacterium]